MIAPNKQPKEIRCAIYTRKSTDEGLEQEFNTLDAQRESGCSLHRQPTPRRLDRNRRRHTTTEALPAATWTGPRSNDCSRTSKPARSTVLSSTRSIDSVDRYSTFRGSWRRSITLDVSFVSVTQQFNTRFEHGSADAEHPAFVRAV